MHPTHPFLCHWLRSLVVFNFTFSWSMVHDSWWYKSKDLLIHLFVFHEGIVGLWFLNHPCVLFYLQSCDSADGRGLAYPSLVPSWFIHWCLTLNIYHCVINHVFLYMYIFKTHSWLSSTIDFLVKQFDQSQPSIYRVFWFWHHFSFTFGSICILTSNHSSSLSINPIFSFISNSIFKHFSIIQSIYDFHS